MRELLVASPARLKHRRWLLKDEFEGASLDTSIWTPTDTTAKLSVSGGRLRCSGGLGIPAWTDPRIKSVQSFERVPGLTLEAEVVWTGAMQTVVGFQAVSPSDAFVFAGSLRSSITGPSVQPGDGAGFNGDALTIVSGQSVPIKVVLKARGYLCYASVDGGASWRLLFENNTDTTSPLYVLIANRDSSYTAGYVRLRRGAL